MNADQDRVQASRVIVIELHDAMWDGSHAASGKEGATDTGRAKDSLIAPGTLTPLPPPPPSPQNFASSPTPQPAHLDDVVLHLVEQELRTQSLSPDTLNTKRHSCQGLANCWSTPRQSSQEQNEQRERPRVIKLAWSLSVRWAGTSTSRHRILDNRSKGSMKPCQSCCAHKVSPSAGTRS